MSKKTVSVSKQEKILGVLYLLFQQFLLPLLLSYLMGLLPFGVSSAVLNLLYFLINFIMVLWIFSSFLKRSWNAVPKQLLRILGISLVAFGLYWVSNMAISGLYGLLLPNFSNLNDASIAALAGSNIYIMALGTVVLVPLVEEVLFRGVLFGAFPHRHRVAAYIVSAAAFALVHVLGYIGSADLTTLVLCFLQYVPAGLCLAWAYDASGSIFTPVLIHTVINALGILSLR